MATALPHRQTNSADPAAVEPPRAGSTDCPKVVPESRALREEILARVVELAATLDKTRPLARHLIQEHARAILRELGHSEQYAGWTMVMLGSQFWHDQVAAVPYQRRLLLLPHCLRDAENCPAKYGPLGLLCENCGGCQLTELRTQAESKGYRVMIAEGSPVVMQIILSGQIDAVLGVACLDVLERALDKILMVGIPSMAVPLLASNCKDSQTDDDWVGQMIDTPHRPAQVRTRSYLHLMRCAAGMFETEQLDRLAPRARGGSLPADDDDGDPLASLDPLAATEVLAYDFLAGGGKHSRPFITLAAYDAMTGARGTLADGPSHVAEIPDNVRRVALAIEVFHKASLVHDDIEDDDSFRYGRETIHRKYGSSTAINVGDYLIGLGYRLVAEPRGGPAPEVAADVLARLAQAHTRLCEGQGAELAWRDVHRRRLSPLEALKIYALKTAPAFDAALYAGIRLAGPADAYREPVARYSRHLGVAFQILNDLEDWRGDRANNRSRGGDVLAGRPTLLWALALEGLGQEDRRRLESLPDDRDEEEAVLARVRELYLKADVFQKASHLIDKHHQRACQVVDSLEPAPLRELLHYFLDTVLKR